MDRLEVALVELIVRWGFRPSDGLSLAVRRALTALLAKGWEPLELLKSANTDDQRLLDVLHPFITVGETYFFRQAEHFVYLARHLAEPARQQQTLLRAWSAACSTGEEAYSLAAVLLATGSAHGERQIEVIGTDVVTERLEVARSGVYPRSSVRKSGPLLHPVVAPQGSHFVVPQNLRDVTRFMHADLLAPLPRELGSFDIIMCRNVLVYLTESAARIVCDALVRRLAPGGLLIFGPMDAAVARPELALLEPPELQIYCRPPLRVLDPVVPAESAVRKPALRNMGERKEIRVLTAPTASASPAGVEPVDAHLAILDRIERGDLKDAEGMLSRLCRLSPDYLPAKLEWAMLLSRTGSRTSACVVMRDVAERLAGVPANALVDGPTPLPASYYQEAARVFLLRERGDR